MRVTIPFFFMALTLAHAEAIPEPSPIPAPSSSKFDSSLLGGGNPTLNDEERAGIEITQAWRDKSYATMAGKPGVDASPKFRFGESLPSVVCAILQVTDIELQSGETVTHINLGDSTRWSVESAQSGSGATQVEHLIVKPRDIGLSTSLVVTTDRRTYHLLLVSDERDFMHYVTFLYGNDAQAVLAPPVAAATPLIAADPTTVSAKVAVVHSRRRRIVKDPPSGKDIVHDDADDSYTVEGKADWKPIQVYSKDGKTYVEMPSSVRHKEAPVLFEEKRSGWWHHDKALVNYRVHGRWYVVDKVIDNATLVSGVGAGQEKVTIRHVVAKKEEEASNGR